jgi:hypothetical protein
MLLAPSAGVLEALLRTGFLKRYLQNVMRKRDGI